VLQVYVFMTSTPTLGIEDAKIPIHVEACLKDTSNISVSAIKALIFSFLEKAQLFLVHGSVDFSADKNLCSHLQSLIVDSHVNKVPLWSADVQVRKCEGVDHATDV